MIYRPDIIILDWRLPDFDRTKVTRRLRDWSQTPIIVLSMCEAKNDKIAALDTGADDDLTKPFGTAYESRMHILQVNINNLRRKIESNPSHPHYFLTKPGVGYRLRV